MTTTPELTAAGRAIGGVRERYRIEQVGMEWCVFTRDDGYAFYPGKKTKDEAQAWIDCEAACAAFESVLPVSDRMVRAMMDADTDKQGMVPEAECLATAIRAINGRDGT